MYTGYTPIPNCCSKNYVFNGHWVFCKKHGYKHINNPGKQLTIEFKI